MKVVNINTGKVIEVTKDFSEHVFYATPEFWAKYKAWANKFGQKWERKFWYGEK
jgi:hypothetical protein